jgi:transposase
MFPHMDNRQTLRLKVARYYLKNGASLRQTALRFHIAYRTVFRWVRLYKEQGEEGLLPSYKRPWNRVSHDFEERIVLMKEREPGLTVRKAKENLEIEGIRISIKGIWGIWKRHGYAGFNQENMSGNFTDCPWTKEAKEKYELAKRLFDQGFFDRSAEMLNSIPALPRNELLLQVPDSSLSMRRQVEKAGLLFGKIPVGSYLERLKSLYEECHRQNLYYSALIVGLVETMALSDVEESRGTKEHAGREGKSLFLLTLCPAAFAPDLRGLCTYRASQYKRGIGHSQNLPYSTEKAKTYVSFFHARPWTTICAIRRFQRN